jgi:hypothetical protein
MSRLNTNVSAKLCNGGNIDENFTRFVGWNETYQSIPQYFSQNTINTISKKVSELTRGVHPKNKIIIVPDEQIAQVMDTVFRYYRPQTGDIYSRYIIPNDARNDINYLVDQVIEIITNHIVNEYGMVEANNKLSAWVQVYGDFNTHNLTQTPPIKTRGKRPAVMQFNMNY